MISDSHKGYRVKRPSKHEELLQNLKNECFPSLAAALMFAGALGYSRGQSEPVSDSAERIPLHYFDPEHIDFMHAVALADKGDTDFLGAGDDKFFEMMTIFENYAAGGLEILAGQLNPADWVGSIELLMATEHPDDIIDDITSFLD